MDDLIMLKSKTSSKYFTKNELYLVVDFDRDIDNNLLYLVYDDDGLYHFLSMEFINNNFDLVEV